MYEERLYRENMFAEGLTYFSVVNRETDLFIAAEKVLREEASKAVKTVRRILTDYEAGHPGFFQSLSPLEIKTDDPEIIRQMKRAAIQTNVGPMAGVAGAVSQYVGEILCRDSSEVIVENGGDIWMKSQGERHVEIHTGNSPFNGLALKISGCEQGKSICTSSGVMGHSLSFGKADAATVISQNAILADCAATALGNRLKSADDIPSALAWIQTVPGISGALAIIDGKLGAWGEVILTK